GQLLDGLVDGGPDILGRRRDLVAHRLECRPSRGGRFADVRHVDARAELDAGPGEVSLRPARSKDSGAGGWRVKRGVDGDTGPVLGDLRTAKADGGSDRCQAVDHRHGVAAVRIASWGNERRLPVQSQAQVGRYASMEEVARKDGAVAAIR